MIDIIAQNLESSEKLVKPTDVEAVSRWCKLFGPALADTGGGPIGSPYELDEWWPIGTDEEESEAGDVPWSRLISEGGRTMVTARQGGRLEILPLFERIDGSATWQLFGLEALAASQMSPIEREKLVFPHKNCPVAYGISYPILRDLTDSPRTYTSTPCAEGDQISLEVLSDRGIVIPSRFGTPWFIGPRLVFDTSGLFAWFLFVTETTGQFMALGRTI